MNIKNRIADYFKFEDYNTNIRKEFIAGLSTFLSLSYIFIVNPSILGQAGMNPNAVLFATIIASAFATLLMGFWARKPFVLAPGMEMNAYVAFFVIIGLGFSWQQGLGAVFWSGIIFMIMTITGIREKIIDSIPDRMKSYLAFSVGIFLMIISLKLAGVLVYEGVIFSGMGLLFSTEAFILYFGAIVILILRKFNIPGSVLISILLSVIVCHLTGIVYSSGQINLSYDMLDLIFSLDLSIITDPRIISVILILFIIDFYGSIAKFIGLTRNTNIIDKEGRMTKMKEALSTDGIGTLFGSVLGTTSITTYVESGVGISQGGRTGFTAVVCALLMLSFFFITPLISFIPLVATTGALFWVGIKMIPSSDEFRKYSRSDIMTLIAMIGGVIITFSIDKALLCGLISFILSCTIKGDKRGLNKYLILSALILLAGTILSF